MREITHDKALEHFCVSCRSWRRRGSRAARPTPPQDAHSSHGKAREHCHWCFFLYLCSLSQLEAAGQQSHEADAAASHLGKAPERFHFLSVVCVTPAAAGGGRAAEP